MANFLTEANKRAIKIAVTDKKASDALIANVNVIVGTHTTVGGDVSEDATVAGVEAGDVVICSYKSVGAVPVLLEGAVAGDGVITFTFDADPDDDHLINYVVYKA